MTNDRVAIFPSRANLVLMKQRIVAASRGLNLLKRKRDALELKLRELMSELAKAKKDVDLVMQEAIFSMTKANYLNTDFKPASVISADRADIFMRIRNNKIAGMLLPTFSLFMYETTSLPLTGLGRGGLQVSIVRKKFQTATKCLIELASLEFSVRTLELGILQNNMRINGLEFVVIPRFVNTVNYIRDELEEFEREDFYRLKRSQAKQRKAKENFTKLIKMRSAMPKQLEEEQQQSARRLQANRSAGAPTVLTDDGLSPQRIQRFDDEHDAVMAERRMPRDEGLQLDEPSAPRARAARPPAEQSENDAENNEENQ